MIPTNCKQALRFDTAWSVVRLSKRERGKMASGARIRACRGLTHNDSSRNTWYGGGSPCICAALVALLRHKHPAIRADAA